jgi:hypothetical protein
MKRPVTLLLLLAVLAAAACGRAPRSRQSFDQIRGLVADRTESEVETLLGKPDVRRRLPGDDNERWLFWNYTFLEGGQYAPELRRQVVHLEITFSNPAPSGSPAAPLGSWRAVSPLAVSFSQPFGPG